MSAFGLFFETALAMIIVYVPGINTVLMTRPLASPHCIIPAMGYFVAMYFYDELRKIYVRAGIVRDAVTGKTIYTGWVARNTFY